MVKIKALIIVLLVALSMPVHAQAKMTLYRAGQKAQVEMYLKSGMEYILIADLCKQFGFPFFTAVETKKLEFHTDEYALKFTPGSPFIVVTNLQNKESLCFQLASPAVHIGDKLYAPWKYSAKYLTQYFGITSSQETPPAPIPEIKTDTISTGITIQVEEKVNGTLVRIIADRPIADYTLSKEENTIHIHIKPIFGSVKKPGKMNPNSVLSSISSRGEKNELVLEIALSNAYASHTIARASEKVIYLTLFNNLSVRDTVNAQLNKDKWKFDVVVIDAGHGGKDAGAIGVNNTIEKEINLALALKLGELIKANMPDVKLVYTRSDDTFIELYRRGQIANENNGKLFISIHCNSVVGKIAGPNGFEIYLLRPGRTQEAIAIAERENNVVKLEDNPNKYEKLTDENFILVTMAHSSFMKYSEKFADLLEGSMRQSVQTVSRGVKQAGFYVLVGASMPGILFETGYVTNPDDAAYMKSKQGQSDIAQGMFNAIKEYRDYYSKEFENK